MLKSPLHTTSLISSVILLNGTRLTTNLAAKAELQATEIEWKMLDLGVQFYGGSGYIRRCL
jgi:acyl-CoA dehydrogenase